MNGQVLQLHEMTSPNIKPEKAEDQSDQQQRVTIDPQKCNLR
jgi:hypothetical protein